MNIGSNVIQTIQSGNDEVLKAYVRAALVYQATARTPVNLLDGITAEDWTLGGNTTASGDEMTFTGNGGYNEANYTLPSETVEVGQTVTLAIDITETTMTASEDFVVSSFSLAGQTVPMDTMECNRIYVAFEVADPITYNKIRILTNDTATTGKDLKIEKIALFDMLVDSENDPRDPYVPPTPESDNLLVNGTDMSGWNTSDVNVSGSGDALTLNGDGGIAHCTYYNAPSCTGKTMLFGFHVDSSSCDYNDVRLGSSSPTGATTLLNKSPGGDPASIADAGTDIEIEFTANSSTTLDLVLMDSMASGQSITISGLYYKEKTSTPTTAPDTPTSISATSTSGSATISWNASEGATSYDVEFDGTVYNTTALQLSVSGLDPNTTYAYRVRAKNDIGDSAYSSSANVTTSSVPTGTDITNYGAVADANYYDTSTKRWYSDSGFTTLATDNTVAIQTALNSGNDINIPSGNFLFNSEIYLYNQMTLSASPGGILRCDPYNCATSGYKLWRMIQIKADNCVIDGLTVESKNAYSPYINFKAKPGLCSNRFAFDPEANNVTIRNCTTREMGRGVDRALQIVRKNIAIQNCSFYDASMPLFLHYVDGVTVDNTICEMSKTGLHNGFHAIYFAKDVSNVTINGGQALCETPHAGTLVQMVHTDNVGACIKNTVIDGLVCKTQQPVIFSVGTSENMMIKNVTITKTGRIIGNPTKLCQMKDYNSNTIFDNINMTADDGTNLIYDSGYLLTDGGDVTVKNSTFNIKLYSGTTLVAGRVNQTWEHNTFNVESMGGGSFVSVSSAKTITVQHNDIVATGTMAVSFSSSKGGVLVLDDNDIEAGVTTGYAFYNNESGQQMTVTNNRFVNYGALASDSDGITASGNTFN